jgi:hypothetical protein
MEIGGLATVTLREVPAWDFVIWKLIHIIMRDGDRKVVSPAAALPWDVAAAAAA